MDLFTSLLVKVIGGIVYATYWLAWQLCRVIWWLAVFLLLSLGAGVAWLARGGHGKAEDTGGFGRYLEDGTLWQDDGSGARYPVAAAGRQYCEVRAAEAGTYWRRTAISRLVRMGAMLRYRFEAVTDPAPDGTREIVAWFEFPQEARHNITLDHVDPEAAAADPYGLEQNRELATDALSHLEWLLTSRGWHPAGHSADPTNAHWYAARYSHPVISLDAPVTREVPAEQSAGLSIEASGGQP